MQAPHKTVYALDKRRPVAASVLDARQLHLLVDLSDLLNAIIDRDVLLRTIMERTSEAMDAEGAAVILLDGGRGEEEEPDLVFHVVAGEREEELSSFRLAWGEGRAGEAARLKKPVIVNDLVHDGKHAKRVDQATGFQTRSLVAIPLMVRTRLVGVLEVVNKKNGGHFADEDVGLGLAIANHVAVAIERARLVEENLKSLRLAAIGETIAGAAHCIKNIVNAIRGGAFVLEKGLQAKKIEKVDTGWHMIEKGLSRISDLSLDMLTYSKERRPQRAATDVAGLVREICAMSREAAVARGVQVVPPDEGILAAQIDPAGIHRCVMNLVANAIDACAGAEPAMKDARVVVRCLPAGDDGVEISIHDNGPGMSPEVQAKLFTPFFSTKGSKGTGLGLSVTRKIIEEHGGELRLVSEPDEGAVFTIHLPGVRKPVAGE